MVSGVKSVKVLQYYCSSLPVSYIIDQRRILVLRSMSHFVSFRIKAVSFVYGVSTVMSNSVIKDVVWDFLLVRFYNFCVFVYVFTFVFWIALLSVMCCLWRNKE